MLSSSEGSVPLDIADKFKLEKSKNQTKSGRKFLQPSIFQKIDAQGSVFTGEPGDQQQKMTGARKDLYTANSNDFNYNLCKNAFEEHCK